MPKIRLVGVTKKFDGVVAADGIDLTIEDGEYLCILGPTGAGKTTLMRTICGLTEPDSGRIFFDDTDITYMDTAKRRATMLSQQYSLFPHMNVQDNVMFGPKIQDWPEESSRQMVKNILIMVHMEARAKAYPRELSGGQQQRIALARALASGSKVLLLDEPLRALDARLRLELRKDLKSMVKEMGLTAVHVTHDQDEALEMADRIAVIRRGQIVQVGTPKEIFENPATPFVANFVGRSNMILGKIDSCDGGISMIEHDSGIKFPVMDEGLKPGTEVLVTVKIGNTKISPVPGEGFFDGKIDKVLYEGATITVEVDAGPLGIVSAKLPNRKYDDFMEGDEVSVDWSPKKARAFSVDRETAEDEMKVE